MRRRTLDADSPEIVAALTAWHESGRASFERSCPTLDYDSYQRKTAKNGKRWLKLDCGTSGAYLVDQTSPELAVYTIKAYGVPHLCIGTLATMIAVWTKQQTQWSSHGNPVG